MPFLIIPNEVHAETAVVWVAVINEQFDPATAVLTYGQLRLPLKDQWIDFSTADKANRIRYQRVTLTKLNPRTSYPLAFSINGQTIADASVTTLPDRLPVAGERPFTVLLGSCFFGIEDKNGDVGRTYRSLPLGAKPDIKILCGDQVYLDNPPHHFIVPRGHNWLQTRSFKTYTDTWTQSIPGGGGFNELLKRNANIFSSDDHEFWNNAPDRGLNVLAFTATQGQRDIWRDIARELYKVFQTEPSPPIQFKVGSLSFCNAETRFSRDSAPGDFMPPNDLMSIRTWIDSLKGPGVLIIGQPLFANKGSIKDWGLPDFRQYSQLLAHLRASRHSIVVLTGDVHFGRVAFANLRPELGTKLYEIISSPMQLVPFAKGNYSPAPQVFGFVQSLHDFSSSRNHFLTLEFTAPSTSRASLAIRFWPIVRNGQPLQSQLVTKEPIELF